MADPPEDWQAGGFTASGGWHPRQQRRTTPDEPSGDRMSDLGKTPPPPIPEEVSEYQVEPPKHGGIPSEIYPRSTSESVILFRRANRANEQELIRYSEAQRKTDLLRQSVISHSVIDTDIPKASSLFGGHSVNNGDGYKREILENASVAVTSFQSTLPSAVDNERFFDKAGEYNSVLEDVERRIHKAVRSRKKWDAPAPERGFWGWLWRAVLQVFMSLTNSAINRLGLSRNIQVALPFAYSYESFAIGGVVRSFDDSNRGSDSFNLSLAFQNRNASRFLVQGLSRWDWLWHLSTQITHSRLFDFLAKVPFLGFFAFAPTENFPSSKQHALNGIFRMLFPGSLFTRRILTTNTEAILTYDEGTAAVNLAAEGNGYEQANRNQYGNFVGRGLTNEYREEHRLPTDESILRTFVSQPTATLVNNGVEHVLRCVAEHWRNMLFQENGNFGHQRMEQLNPFETLRFHMPLVLTTLASLRGRNAWDTTTLGPFVYKLQSFDPSRVNFKIRSKDVENASDDVFEIEAPSLAAQKLVMDLKTKIVRNVCGGVPSRMEPLNRWLDAIHESLEELSREAEEVKLFVATVDRGIKVGNELFKLVNWVVPSDALKRKAVINVAKGKEPSVPGLSKDVVERALSKLAAKDERTLRELLNAGHSTLNTTQLLVGRVCTLLEREVRRESIDRAIRKYSVGKEISARELQKNTWYWLEDSDSKRKVVCTGIKRSNIFLRDAATYTEFSVPASGSKFLEYAPVAESISRAQKAFMTIELDYGKKFSYNAFMEFGSSKSKTSLRSKLRRLVTLAQVHSDELDQARRNVLSETKRSLKKFRTSPAFAASRLVQACKPQNVLVMGGGPTGLLAAVHSLQNVILTGGILKVYEKRDAISNFGAAFERAQIVRLDPRQIGMLRYHLGTGFEDVYTPGKGETNAHLGNTLPTQGFVEVTIKRLEKMIFDEVISLVARDLMVYYTESAVDYKVKDGDFWKKGDNLKVGDAFFKDDMQFTVSDLVYPRQLSLSELQIGQDYDVVLPRENVARSFRLTEKIDDLLVFTTHDVSVPGFSGRYGSLPPIYKAEKGQKTTRKPTTVIVESKGARSEMKMSDIARMDFQLDFSNTHVIAASGKPAKSSSHLYLTPSEPYSVCCIEGLKISMGMHNFGEKRFKNEIADDFRSPVEPNTRIIGDFTKSVDVVKIIEKMGKLVQMPSWMRVFDHVAELTNERISRVGEQVRDSFLEDFVHNRLGNETLRELFRRKRLQTRFFELGNNSYLGMELLREYDLWKTNTVEMIAPSLPRAAAAVATKIRVDFQRTLTNHIDRLWYDATFSTILEGDVYAPGSKRQIPVLRLVNSQEDSKLGDVDEQSAFHLLRTKYKMLGDGSDGVVKVETHAGRFQLTLPCTTNVQESKSSSTRLLSELRHGDSFEVVDVFEVISKSARGSVVRNSSGSVVVMPRNTVVRIASDLSRGSNGFSESKVALAAFPVAHAVSHRTLRLNGVKKSKSRAADGFITCFVGDAQTSPHFMRYSGLTGACINCMSFNNMIGQALSGVAFKSRIQRYFYETEWSNGEVVERGTGHNYGQDGFLRPGFPYRSIIDYLFDKVEEQEDIGSSSGGLLSRDWKTKLAAALVPRGLENNGDFRDALFSRLRSELAEKRTAEQEKAGLSSSGQEAPAPVAFGAPQASANERHHTNRREGRKAAELNSKIEAVAFALRDVVDHSVVLRNDNSRLSSELYNQPKPVDSVVDDFAVEAQNFANSLTQSVALAAASISLRILDDDGLTTRITVAVSAILGVWSIFTAFGSMTNIARYKNRNEEMRRLILQKKMPRVLRSIFSLVPKSERKRVSSKNDPLRQNIEKQVAIFLENAKYYNADADSVGRFNSAYKEFTKQRGSRSAAVNFSHEITTTLVADVFHVNSYLQAYLVEIYKALDEMITLEDDVRPEGSQEALALYQRLHSVVPKLEASIEDGPIKFGFLRTRKFNQLGRSALPITLRFIFGWMCGFGNLSTLTRGILNDLEKMEVSRKRQYLHQRPLRDFKELHFATRESEIASVMFLSAFLVFCLGIFFTIFRLVDRLIMDNDVIDAIGMFVIYGFLGSFGGTCIALFHFLRKIGHLMTVHAKLGVKTKDAGVRRVRFLAIFQVFLVVLRILSLAAAAVAIPWVIYIGTPGTNIEADWVENGPVALALASVYGALFAGVLFFFTELVQRYNLDPCLGDTICGPLKHEILLIKRDMESRDPVSIETIQKLEAEAWEYTARSFLHKYRLDTVFGADRFGTILGYLQSGWDADEKAEA